jgi:hypothetical protein
LWSFTRKTVLPDICAVARHSQEILVIPCGQGLTRPLLYAILIQDKEISQDRQVVGDSIMPVRLKSSDVQQSFGEVVDRALLEDDVIVERYGTPRVAIVGYKRYQHLVEAEQELLRTRLQQASAAASARAEYLTEEEVDELIERARSEVHQETSGE